MEGSSIHSSKQEGQPERPKGEGHVGKQKQTRRPKQKAKKRLKNRNVIGKASNRKPISVRERLWEAL